MIDEILAARRSNCAANNADWYAAMFRAHAIAQQRNQQLWTSRFKAPAFHSNLISLAKESGDQILTSIVELNSTLQRPWAIKDSFASLELKALGFKILFEASWIWREATGTIYSSTKGWTKIQSSEELRTWEQAWRVGQTVAADPQFPAALLQEPSITFLGLPSADGYSAGCIVNTSSTVSGFSNFFSITPNIAANYAAAAAMAQSIAPAKPLTSFERGTLLACAENLGFENVGPLRIWHNP